MLSDSPLVSIIIPLHNKEEWIVDTLRSVTNQTYKFWECIIVNDGSTDSSLQLAEGYIKQTPGNWKIFSTPHSGQARARNLGLGKAIGTYCAFLDGDDLWPQQKLSKQIETALKHNADLVLGPYLIFQNRRCTSFVRHRNIDLLSKGWLGMYGFGGALESGGLIKTTTLQALLFDENYSITSGLDLFLRLAEKYRIIYCDYISFLYRISNQQEHNNILVLCSEMRQIIESQNSSRKRFLCHNLNLFENFPRGDNNLKKFLYIIAMISRNPVMTPSFLFLTLKRKLLGKLRLYIHFKYLNTVFKSLN